MRLGPENEQPAFDLIALVRASERKERRELSRQVVHELNVVGYTRMSTALDAQLHSTPTQTGHIFRYCDQKGYPKPRIFSDMAVSGTLDERPQWEQLMVYVKANPGCVVVVYDMTRFARTLEVFVTLYKQIQRAKGRLEMVNNATENTLLMAIMAVMSELEHRLISTRLRDGRKRVAKEGKKLGHVPWGYKLTTDGKDIAVDESLLEHIRHLYRMRLGGSEFSDLAEYLNEQGISTPTGKRVWQPSSLPRILYSLIYVGVVKNKITKFGWEDSH